MPVIHEHHNPHWNSQGDPVWSRRLLIVLFLLAVTAPGVGHVLGLFDLSYIETTELRRAAERPKMPHAIHEIPKMFRHMDDYLNDHFGFRSSLITANSLFNYALGGRVGGNVVRGREGWLFDANGLILDEYRGLAPYTDAGLDKFVTILKQREAWTREHGIPMLIVVAPFSFEVSPGMMPDWMLPVGPSRADQFFAALKSTEMNALDLRPAFRDLSKTDRELYYKTDFHWNLKGGYQGYKLVADRVKDFMPSLPVVQPSDFEFKRRTGVRGMGLAQQVNLGRWLREDNYFDIVWRGGVSALSAFERIKGKWVPTAPGEEAHEHSHTMKIINPAAKGPRVMLYRDSFGNCMSPFLNATCREVVYASHNFLGFDTRLIEEVKPDIIIYLFVEEKFYYDPEPIYDRDWAGPPDYGLMNYKAEMTLDDPPSKLGVDADWMTPVTLLNLSNWTWPHDGKRRVVLTHRWLDPATRKPLDLPGAITALPEDLLWKHSVQLNANIRSPKDPGRYILQFVLRQENTTDFDAHGGETAEIPVTIIK